MKESIGFLHSRIGQMKKCEEINWTSFENNEKIIIMGVAHRTGNPQPPPPQAKLEDPRPAHTTSRRRGGIVKERPPSSQEQKQHTLLQ